jgi:hypothetical protein
MPHAIRSIALLHHFRPVKTGNLRYIDTPGISCSPMIWRKSFWGEPSMNFTATASCSRSCMRGCGNAARARTNGIPLHAQQARAALGWGDTQLWIHLVASEMEFLIPPSRPARKTLEYELLYFGEMDGRAHLLGLIDCTVFQSSTYV